MIHVILISCDHKLFIRSLFMHGMREYHKGNFSRSLSNITSYEKEQGTTFTTVQ